MSLSKVNTNGEISEYLEGDNNMDKSEAFKAKPKISRTPPQKTNIIIKIDKDEIDNDDISREDGTYQSHSSQNINSPSLSIEYPPGSSIPRIKNRKPFQFKKSHYQRFVGTSSAKKTKQRRNSITTNNNINNIDNNTSLPPSPPSDDIISTLSQIMNKTPNKLPVHITRNLKDCIDSDSTLSVSSSPSLLIQDINTTKDKYRSRQHWTIKEKTHSLTEIDKKIKLSSNVIDESNKIRIALNQYDQRKGQNLEELFKPQKKCFYCLIL